VELGGVTRFVWRSQITHVEAQGDYARLHTAHDSHLLRRPLSTLEQEWATAGFVRIHRSLLVSIAHVDGVRMDAGRCTVSVAGHELLVSRRHTRELRDLLTRGGRTT
ncbi:MAG: LytR/AlgR family response regulator transcription factor, partial [Nocardioides sp.]